MKYQKGDHVRIIKLPDGYKEDPKDDKITGLPPLRIGVIYKVDGINEEEGWVYFDATKSKYVRRFISDKHIELVKRPVLNMVPHLITMVKKYYERRK